MEYSDAVSEFESFVNQEIREDLISAVQGGQSVCYASWQSLDDYYYELVDYLMDKPDEALAAFNQAVRKIDSVPEFFEIRFENPPPENIVLRLRSQQIGCMIAVEGVVTEVSDITPKQVSTTYECESCSKAVTKDRGWETKSPYKCDECGSRKFEAISRELRDSQELTVTSKDKIDVELSEDQVRDKSELLEQEVEILGIVRLDDSGENSLYLEAHSISDKSVNNEISDSSLNVLESIIGETYETSEVDGFLDDIGAYKFEEIVAEVFSRAGWRTELTQRSGDMGIDMKCRKRFPFRRKYLIQAKYTSNPDKNPISLSTVRDYNSLYDQEVNVDKVILITTGYFSDQVRGVKDELPIKLMDRDDVKRMLENLSEIEEKGQLEVETEGEEDNSWVDEIEVSEESHEESEEEKIVTKIADENISRKSACEIDHILQEAEQEGVDPGKAEEIIYRMQREGELFEPEKDKLRQI